MNGPDFHKDRRSLQLLGKEFVIVLVVVFSALSFTLGYFVGKSGEEKNSGGPEQAVEMSPVPQRTGPDALPPPQNNSQGDNSSTTSLPENTESAPAEIQQKGPLAIVENGKSDPPKADKAANEKQAAQQLPKGNESKPDTKDSTVSRNSDKQNGDIYTVQLAAFRSSSEAKSFSKIHAKKGLKTYIITSTGKNNEKIYKVRSGEYRDRKDAEVMSLKLNKTEKMKTFVTLKSE